MIWYTLLKFIHVLSAVIWIGGIAATMAVTGRMLRTLDRVALTSYFPHGMVLGQKMIGPSAGLVLLSGIPLVIIGKHGFGTFWVTWGFVGMIVHFVFGATVIRKRSMELAELLKATPPDDARIAAVGAKVRIANLIYLLVMISVIGAMVLKPTL